MSELEQVWRERIEWQQQSGITVAECCEAEGGLRDEFQQEAWEKLNADPETPFYRIVNTGNGRGLRYAISDRMRSSCVQCHEPYTRRRSQRSSSNAF